MANIQTSGSVSTPSPAAAPAETNPSVRTSEPAKQEGFKRIPMSLPVRRMEVPEIPGWHLYWFVETNVPRALQGGYEFVKTQEVPIHQRNPATSADLGGNADLGTNVSMIAGTRMDGQPLMQVLMKIRLEWRKEDQKRLEDINANILSSIFKGETIVGSDQMAPADQGTAYVDPDRTSMRSAGVKPLYQRPRKKQI